MVLAETQRHVIKFGHRAVIFLLDIRISIRNWIASTYNTDYDVTGIRGAREVSRPGARARTSGQVFYANVIWKRAEAFPLAFIVLIANVFYLSEIRNMKALLSEFYEE